MAMIGSSAHAAARACVFLLILIIGANATTAQAAGKAVVTMLSQVNALRARVGLDPLVPDARLMRAAQRQSEELARLGSLTHLPPSGDLGTRVLRVGYRYWLVEENLAAGMVDPAKVLRAWLRSPGHRANLLRAEVNTVGIGYVRSGGGFGNYWTLIMAQPGI